MDLSRWRQFASRRSLLFLHLLTAFAPSFTILLSLATAALSTY